MSDYEDGVNAAAVYVSDYLNSLINFGRLSVEEERLIENLLDHFENALDPDTL